MKLRCMILCLILCAGCSDMPDEPQPAKALYKLTIIPQYETIWSGDSVQFAVIPEFPVPQGSEYVWHYWYSDEDEYEITSDSKITVLIPTVSWFYITVAVRTDGIGNDRYDYGYYSSIVHVSTGVLSMDPDTAYWDTGIPLPLSVSYNGRIPSNAIVLWNFGDGAEVAASPSVTVLNIFETPGAYMTAASLKLPGSDSTLAITRGHVEIEPGTAGRFLRFTITGLERTYSYPSLTKSDPITATSRNFLRWFGDQFLLKDGHWTLGLRSNWLTSCGGQLNGDKIDTLRIDCNFGGLFSGHRISLKLKDIPRVSEHKWMMVGAACAESLIDYSDIVFDRSDKRKYLKSWRFLEDARIEIEIDHNRP